MASCATFGTSPSLRTGTRTGLAEISPLSSQPNTRACSAWRSPSPDPGRPLKDIVQEAFVRGHQRWSKVSAYDRPGAWLRRVVINPALSARRRLSREALAYLRLANTRADDPGGGVEGDLEFWRTVRCLPRRQAEVVALYYWEDLSVTEVAAILEIREGTVRALLHQGRRRVASALGVEAPDD